MEAARYREVGPDGLPAVLRGAVECAWRSDLPASAPTHRQRVLPDGCMDLLLVDDRIVVAGPDTTAHVAEQAPGTTMTGLRFRSGALPGLLGVPAAELRDVRVDLADVLSRDRAAAARYCAASAPRAGVAVLSDAVAVLRGDADAGPLAPLPGIALTMLRRGATAAAVADELGCTSRTLHRRCVETAGYGPSVLRRILRFRAASTLLYTGVSPAEAAARAGYADQPHLSREVRSLSGLSPSQLASPTL